MISWTKTSILFCIFVFGNFARSPSNLVYSLTNLNLSCVEMVRLSVLGLLWLRHAKKLVHRLVFCCHVFADLSDKRKQFLVVIYVDRI